MALKTDSNKMRMRQFSTLWLLFTLASLVTSTQVDSDGGYTGLVIKINKEVAEEQCPEILANLKALLRDSSKVLNKALNNKVYLKSATIVVPATWKDSSCRDVILQPTGNVAIRDPDVLVDPEHPIYGNSPYTQQSKGCGESGDFVSLPAEFLTKWNSTVQAFGDPAKIFVHEFVKHRFGIFDEFGFNHDKLFPNHFFHNGKLLPTGTTNVPVKGGWVSRAGQPACDPLQAECFFRPNANDNQDIKCSLGFLANLQGVERYCHKNEVPVMAPTKHNVLCQGKSVYEVIFSYVDFKKINGNKALAVTDLNPKIDVVREPMTQYVLVMETTATMDQDDHWKWINKAAQKLIRYDLQVNSNLAIVTFNDQAKVEHSMVQINSNEVRARLADAIPDKYHLARSTKSCVLCAIQTVLHRVLSKDNLAGTHIILMTQGSDDSLSVSDRNILKNYIQDFNLKVSSIILPQTKNQFLDFYTKHTETFVINNENNIMDFYVDLNEALADVVASDNLYPTENAQVIHKQSFLGAGPGQSRGTFAIDSSLGRDTVFGIYVEDEEEHQIKAITFTDANKQSYGPFVRMSSSFDLINFKTINFPRGQAPPFNAVGKLWEYSIEWHSDAGPASTSSVDGGTRKSIVVVTSKPRTSDENELFSVNVWTNEVRNNAKFEPITIFAQVQKGGWPVLGARVVVTVLVEPETGDNMKLTPIILDDGGNGDPDLISGDGIYSRYLTHYPVAGRYKMVVSVDDNDGRAFVATLTNRIRRFEWPQIAVPPTCCGSTVSLSPDQTEVTGVFSRTVRGPVVEVASVPGQDMDVLPPSRIADLKINVLPGSNKLLAAWTAPGGDFNDGSVNSYRFVYSTDMSDLLNANATPKILLGFDRMEAAGTQSTIEFEFPYYDKDFYVSIFAFDKSGNRGKISNLVHVHVKSPPSLLSAEENGASPIFSITGGNSDLDWIMIGIISGVVGVLLLMSIVAISYYFITARKKSAGAGKAGSTSSMMNGGCSDETDSSSFDSDIKHIMSNPLGPSLSLQNNPAVARHLGQQQPGGSSVDSGVSSNDSNGETPTNVDHLHGGTSSHTVTPVYWSASQLLSKLDQPQHGYGPYVHSDPYGPAGVHQVPTGPHSLQPVSLSHGPSSIHNVSFTESLRYSTASGRQTGQQIPEEYTITVGKLSGDSRRSSSVSNSNAKVPPPVLPKPRNITQV